MFVVNHPLGGLVTPHAITEVRPIPDKVMTSMDIIVHGSFEYGAYEQKLMFFWLPRRFVVERTRLHHGSGDSLWLTAPLRRTKRSHGLNFAMGLTAQLGVLWSVERGGTNRKSGSWDPTLFAHKKHFHPINTPSHGVLFASFVVPRRRKWPMLSCSHC